MNRDANHVFSQVRIVWENLIVAMQKMSQPSTVRPSTAHDVFQLDQTAPDDEVKFNFGPVVFNVPERVGRGHNLFVVVKGWLSFGDCDMRVAPLRTKSFGTKVGYFRRKQNVLEHVYGVHYDLDESLPGHPVFHAQVSSQIELGQEVQSLYHLEMIPTDLFKPKLRNIRIPTAQMDVFSTIIQICADHLVDQGADQSAHDAFSAIRVEDGFFVGAAHRMAYLNGPPANTCYRSAHWYR